MKNSTSSKIDSGDGLAGKRIIKSSIPLRRPGVNLPCLLVGSALLSLAALGQANYTAPYTFTTLAGNAGYGSADGTNSAARFAVPWDAAVDSSGNVYVADTLNNTIRKVTPAGVVTTLAGRAGVSGSADGTNSAALFDEPTGVAVDTSGNVYVGDACNSTIRKVTPTGTNWVVTTMAGLAGASGSADGTNSAARFYVPIGIAVDGAGNLYVADTYNDAIRKVAPVGTNWVVTTIAGLAGVPGNDNGSGPAARFNYPVGVALDGATNLYVTDEANDTIRKLTPTGTTWTVTTIAGLAGSSGTNNGIGSAARFYSPDGLAMDGATNLYVADRGNSTIRKMTPLGVNWMVTTLAGQAGITGTNNGIGTNAEFDYPVGVAVDSATNLYVADTFNNLIRRVTPAGTNWMVTTLAGLNTAGAGSADGTGAAAQFSYPIGVALDSAGNVYVGDMNNDTIRKVTPAGVVTTLAGQVGITGSHDGTGSAAQFSNPNGVAVDTDGNIYVADWGNHTIRKMTPVGTNWVVTTLAGKAGVPGLVNATGTNAEFDYPNGVAVDTNGNVYVADTGNTAIRKVTPGGVVTTVSTDFSGPTGVAADTNGFLYVADYYSDTIRRVAPGGGITILAGESGVSGGVDGTGSSARFNSPYSVAVDSATNLYVGDRVNNTIRKMTPVGTTWVVSTLGGIPNIFGYADGTGRVARLDGPCTVALDSAANLYVVDQDNNVIRKGYPTSSVPPPNLQAASPSAGQFGFGIIGFTNLAVGIESSSNLSQWQVVGILTLEGGTNSFVISPNTSQSAQFFRGHVR